MAFFVDMRLDIFLKLSRLIPRRPLAKKFADSGLVKVNGSKAKSSKTIKEGDRIEISRHNRKMEVRVSQIPRQKQVSKKAAAGLYELISDEKTEDDILSL